LSLSVAELAEINDWDTGDKLAFVSQSENTITLQRRAGELVCVSSDVYRDMVAFGYARRPGEQADLDFIPDKTARRKQEMKLFAVRRDEELRENGNAPAKAFAILDQELRDHDRHGSFVPKAFNSGTLRNWKKKLKEGGPTALLPRTDKQGNTDPRHDSIFEECVFDILEELFLKSDRISVSLASSKAEKVYRDKCESLKIKKPKDCGKKSFLAVLTTLRADDIIAARNDTETAKKLRLQAQFYARVVLPYDLVEIDTTPADIHLADEHGRCIGRPTVSAAVDAATGWVLGLRVSLEPANEVLTIQTLKDAMTPRDDAFFERWGIRNRFRTSGAIQILSCDQGSENSGEWLPGIIAQSGMELGKNIPGCPEKKPFVERFMRELNSYLHIHAGATTSETMPNKTRTEKAMAEACLTLEELEGLIYRWLYDIYAEKIRRLIHSPLRVPESPQDSWNRLVGRMAQFPLGPEEIARIFMAEEGSRKLQHYGLDVRGVQYHSKELGKVYSILGRKAVVDVRYDPGDIRAISVVHMAEGVPSPLIVPAKSKDIAPIGFDAVKKIKTLSPAAKEQDLEARSKMFDLAVVSQKLAEDRGTDKASKTRKARKQAQIQKRAKDMKQKAAKPVCQPASARTAVNQSSPRMPVRRRDRRPQLDTME